MTLALALKTAQSPPPSQGTKTHSTILFTNNFSTISSSIITHSKYQKSSSQQASKMGSCISKPSILRRGSQVKTVNDKESSLYMLPVEILQYISASFLSADAAASLALCSHSMLNILGSQAFRSLRLERHTIEKIRFLKNLERDLPDWLFCHHCSMFHPVNQKEDPSQRFYYSDETECTRVMGIVSIDLFFNIRYEHAQLIMRNYRLGRPYEIYLKRLSNRYARRRPDYSLESVYTADIVEGELLIHIKHTLRLLKDWDISTIRLNLPAFCSHLIDRWLDSVFAQTLRCRLSHANRLPCIECEKRKVCPKCSTSYQVDIRTLEDLVTEVQVDVWRCLGSCESPFNSEWRKQAERYRPNTRQRK